MTLRPLETEHDNTPARKYAYSFDYRMHDYMLRELAPFSGIRALELGCYEGAMTANLARIFPDLTVVEGAADLIAIAKERVPGPTYVLGRFETYRPPQTFDAIFLIHTLEHLDEPHETLQRIATWLAPEGKLYVVVPNAYAASRQIAVRMGKIIAPRSVTEAEYAHGHRRTYDLYALRGAIEAAGMRTPKSGGIFFKALANFQIDRALTHHVIDEEYMEGCYLLGKRYPNLCSSIYCVGTR